MEAATINILVYLNTVLLISYIDKGTFIMNECATGLINIPTLGQLQRRYFICAYPELCR